MSKPAIRAENISKVYQIGEFTTGTLTRDIERWFYRVQGKEDPFLKIGEENDRSVKAVSDIVWSLRNINFQINRGDAVGIIGRNGAGKSTLLKILSRVTSPTTGIVKVKGRIASLLEVGTGFHPELTGRENIYLNGAILGMRRMEISRKFDEIVDFSGVERYIDTPVKRYSSGMYVRLAFAVAAYLESEILIVDEILAVGDAEFQKKCLGKMSEVSRGEGRTVLFVSHNLGSILQLCNHAILLKQGNLVNYGRTVTVVEQYKNEGTRTANIYTEKNKKQSKIYFTRVYPCDGEKNLKDQFFHDEAIHFRFELCYNIASNDEYRIFFIVQDEFKNRIFSSESDIINSNEIMLAIDAHFLVRGNYSIIAFIHKPSIEQIDVIEDVCNFSVIDNGSEFNIHGSYDYGRVFSRANWVITS